MPVKKIRNGIGGIEFRPDAQAQPLTYEISLLTPLVGGGVKSWVPDKNMPFRSQSIKGHLRFWWRAMQADVNDPSLLRETEKALWGGTAKASKVRIALECHPDVKFRTLEQDDRGNPRFDNLPDYVLFPLQGQRDMAQYEIIQKATFTLSVQCPEADKITIDRCVHLWVLFGGMGARTRRGCGSLFCREIMDKFQSTDDLKGFLSDFVEENGLNTAKWPRLNGARITYRLVQHQSDPVNAWKSFLDRYKHFRQGINCGRNPGVGSRPGRTRWPEADALRRLTNCINGKHKPEHLAGNWFPRGAYGLPIQTEFRNEPSDPKGKFMLQPDGGERWPSPAILKIVKLGNGDLMEVCLILNLRMPENLEVSLDNRHLHQLLPAEMPLMFDKKKMPEPGPIKSKQNPYEGLIAHLNLKIL